jgi:hypothetical protein
MKPRQFQRLPAEYGSSTAQPPSLRHRMRDAAAFAWPWARRKADVAMDMVPTIEDQLRMLHPSAVPSGRRAALAAVRVRWRSLRFMPSTNATRWG